ncbi:MAG: hypothetical protein K2H85_03900 [Allobaculum sp.]|nr:hypothetical protein [Allobaculum sp.]
MNLYVYFASPYVSTYKVPHRFQKQAEAFILKVKNSPLPLRIQQSLLYPLIQSLHEANRYESQEKAEIAFQKAHLALKKAIVDEEKDTSHPLLTWCAKHPILLRYSDFLAFGAVWIGGYQALNQILETHNLGAMFSFGFSNLGQALSGYICIHLTLDVLMRLDGWKRWSALAALFGVYLLLMKLFGKILVSVPIPAINVILICVLIFFISLALYIYVYGNPIRNDS